MRPKSMLVTLRPCDSVLHAMQVSYAVSHGFALRFTSVTLSGPPQRQLIALESAVEYRVRGARGSQVMVQRDIRNLPVVDGDELVGILNVMDVVGTIVKHQSDHIDHMNSYIQDGHPYSA